MSCALHAARGWPEWRARKGARIFPTASKGVAGTAAYGWKNFSFARSAAMTLSSVCASLMGLSLSTSSSLFSASLSWRTGFTSPYVVWQTGARALLTQFLIWTTCTLHWRALQRLNIKRRQHRRSFACSFWRHRDYVDSIKGTHEQISV